MLSKRNGGIGTMHLATNVAVDLLLWCEEATILELTLGNPI